MTTSTYTIIIAADNASDATDIAKRRARDDGYAVRTVKRVLPIRDGRYAVDLAVVRQ